MNGLRRERGTELLSDNGMSMEDNEDHSLGLAFPLMDMPQCMYAMDTDSIPHSVHTAQPLCLQRTEWSKRCFHIHCVVYAFFFCSLSVSSRPFHFASHSLRPEYNI